MDKKRELTEGNNLIESMKAIRSSFEKMVLARMQLEKAYQDFKNLEAIKNKKNKK